MANQQLLDYMKTQTANGWKEDALLAAVRKAGWQESAIQEVLREMRPPTPTARPAAASIPVAQPKPVTPAAQAPIRTSVATPVQTASMPATQRPATAQQDEIKLPPLSAKPVSAAVQPARPASNPTPAATPAMQNSQRPPLNPLPKNPVAIDASGNPTTRDKINAAMQAAIKPTLDVDADDDSFGTPQMPQMRSQAYFPSKSRLVTTPVPTHQPIQIQPTVSAGPSIIQPPVQRVQAQPERFVAPAINPAAKNAMPVSPQQPEPERMRIAPPVETLSKPAAVPNVMMPQTKPIEESLPVFAKQANSVPIKTSQAGTAAPIRMNPAFIPGARIAQPMPSVTPVTSNPGVRPQPAQTVPVFQGMRPGSQPAMPMQSGIQSSVIPQRQPIRLGFEANTPAAAPKKKSRTSLLVIGFILALIVAGGAYAYLAYPETALQVQNQITDSVQSVISGNSATKQPGEVLASALEKLLSTNEFNFSAKVTGSVTSFQNPSSNVSLAGNLSGSVASVLPFPASKDALKLAISRPGSATPAISVNADLLTSADQGVYFKLSDIQGTEAASRQYDQLKNAWISIDPASAGIDKIVAIFSSPGFSEHESEIRDIIVKSGVFAVTNDFNDDPGSGLYHYGLSIQKDNVLPAIIDIAQAVGATLTEEDKSSISDSIASANFPSLEVWIDQSSFTMNRIKATVNRAGAVSQNLGFDVSLTPLVGNPPEITAPENAVPLGDALAPAQTQPVPAAKAPLKKK